MALSSKQIILYIKRTGSAFSAGSIAEDIISDKKSKKQRRPKKKQKGLNERELFNRIKNVLNALVSIGYLKRDRKRYVKVLDFKIKGKISINTSGNGILRTDTGDELIILKEFINNAHNNDLVTGDIYDYRDGYYYGKITGVIERQREIYFAKFINRKDNISFYKLLDTPGEPEVCVKMEPGASELPGFLTVRLKDNYISGRQECTLEESFAGIEESDFKRIVIKHNLPGDHPEYEELKEIENIVKSESGEKRKDYREFYTITIDGEYAKDFDDAISLEVTHDRYKLYVHIADVSSFVKKDSRLDLEARSRGTSFYPGNRVIPMLPEILSNDFCSLREGLDRLTMTAEITFDNQGNEVESSFNRGIINVDKRLTYKSSNDIFLQKGPSRMGTLMKQMNTLADILKQRRLSEGRIDLSLQDYELVYQDDMLRDIRFAERLRSHMIIEEFMLSANVAVSRALTESGIPSLYRIHESISDEKLSMLERFFRTLGLKLNRKEKAGVALQKIIDHVENREFKQVVNFIILKSFMQAYYGPEPLGHFGLGFADYTHFTSPIRRYPDLIVHRCLKSLIDNSAPIYEIPELDLIGEISSDMERVAQNAERDLYKMKCCRFMEGRVGEKFDAVISGITKAGFFVTLIDRPVEGMVPLRYLTDDYYLVVEDEYTVTGKRLGKRYRLGDRVKVVLMDVSIETMRIDFEVV